METAEPSETPDLGDAKMEGRISSLTYDATNASASMVVEEGGQTGAVEYNATVPLRDDAGDIRSPAVLRAALMDSLRSQRAAQLPPPPTDLGIAIGEHVDLGA